MNKDKQIQCSCRCGAIQFEAEIIPDKIYNCHCSQCRKSHGATFATQTFAKGDTLKFHQGEDLISEYKEQRGIRAFCSRCGSRLMNYAEDKRLYLSIAIASINSGLNQGPVAHAYVSAKAQWHQPSTDIPAYAEMPDGAFD